MLTILRSYKTFVILRHVWIHITILWWMYIVECLKHMNWPLQWPSFKRRSGYSSYSSSEPEYSSPYSWKYFFAELFNGELKYTAICAPSICWNGTERIKTGRHWRQSCSAPYYWAIVTLDSEPDPDSELWSSIIPNSIIVVPRGCCLK